MCWPTADPIALGFEQFRLDSAGDGIRDLVLQLEQVGEVTVEPLCPKMRVCFGINQLGVDAHPSARPANASFQKVAHAQLATDLPRFARPVPVGECCIARNHQHVRESGQGGRQILGDPVSKILLAWVTAKIVERQDDN